MSSRSFGVLWASRPFVVDCLTGDVWITQEVRREDIVLEPGERCNVAGLQKVLLNAFDGALLAILDTQAGGATAGPRPKPLELRLKVTRGAYTLSGRGVARPCFRVVLG